MSIKLPNESRLSRIPTAVLVGAWALAIVLAAGCLIWALLAPWGGGGAASISPTPTKAAAVVSAKTPTKPAPATTAPTAAPQAQATQPTASPAAATPTAAPVAKATQPGPATPTALPMNEAFGYGIQVNGLNDYDASETSVNMVSQLKMTWIKQQIKWGLMEKQPGQLSQPDIDYLDRLVRKANKSGIKVMLSIVSAPKWSHPAIDDIEAPPDDMNAYANFVGQLIDRYKSKGNAIHAVEVWNEQNISREWHTNPQQIDAARYMQMLSLTYKAVKVRDPNIIVISGALSPTGWDDGVEAVDDFKYLQQMVNVGLLNNADCIGIHHNGYNIGPNVPYEDAPKQPKAATALFRGPFDNLHHSWSFYTTLHESTRIVNKQKPLCITEFGWPSAEGVPTPIRQGFEFAKDNSLQDQANYIVQAYQLMRQWGFVKLAFLWNLNFFNSSDATTSDNPPYSILTSGGLPRPAFDALGKMPKP